MPRLHFPDQALVLRMVEAAVTSGKPLMLAHDHGVYLCHDDIRHPAPGTGCICAFVDGMEPEVDPEAFETANAFVGFDDFGISIPLGGQDALLADLKRGHRLAIGFGRRAVTIVTQAPPTKQSQPTRAARGRGAKSHPTARMKDSNMKTATKKTKSTKSATKKNTTKAAAGGAKLRKAAIAEIGARIATLDRAPTANGKGATSKQAKNAPTKTHKEKKASKAKRTSALDAAAQVLEGAKEPMTAGAMITAMADRGLWTSPGGKTPHATLYAALIREIKAKGKDARFTKTDRGMFAFNGRAA